MEKNVLVIFVGIIVVLGISFFTPLWPDSLKTSGIPDSQYISDEEIYEQMLKQDNEPAAAKTLHSSKDLKTEEELIGEITEETVFYCNWVWPQQIINKETKEVYWNCNYNYPYCLSGTTQCCSDAGHTDCVEMNTE